MIGQAEQRLGIVQQGRKSEGTQGRFVDSTEGSTERVRLREQEPRQVELPLIERFVVGPLAQEQRPIKPVPVKLIKSNYLRIMYNLAFNRVVFNSLLKTVNGYILGELILVHLRNVLGLVLHGVVVSVTTFTRDVLHVLLFLVLDVRALVGYVLDP